MNTQLIQLEKRGRTALLTCFALTCLVIAPLNAQTNDTVTINSHEKVTIIAVSENGETTKITLPHTSIVVKEHSDTVSTIIIGNRRLEIIEDDDHTKIRMVRNHIDKFKGHFAGIDLGFNNLVKSNFSTSYPVANQFMELNSGKSINVGINFMQYSIPLLKNNNNVGLVTGAALNISNYRFDNPFLLTRDATTGKTIGEAISADGLKKNKLVTTYLNIPLLLEMQMPSSSEKKKVFISAGGFVGFKLGSHTKTVYENNEKDKNRENMNIRPYQCGLSARVGYHWLKLFANYNCSSLFQADKGPELYPFTVGITLINL